MNYALLQGITKATLPGTLIMYSPKFIKLEKYLHIITFAKTSHYAI